MSPAPRADPHSQPPGLEGAHPALQSWKALHLSDISLASPADVTGSQERPLCEEGSEAFPPRHLLQELDHYGAVSPAKGKAVSILLAD